MQFALLGSALGQQLLQLRHAGASVALGDRDHLAVLELGQLALVIAGLARCVAELVLERSELLLAVLFVAEEGQGLFEHLLQGFLFSLGQLALGDLVQAFLDRRCGWRFSRPDRGEGQAQPDQGCA
ncbi:hypothetical protein D3C79_843040 [compost metagenome]